LIYIECFTQKLGNIYFFSAAHGTFSKTDILRHKAILNTLKKIKITPCIISDNKRIKLDLNNNNNKKHRKYSNTWRLNNTNTPQTFPGNRKGRNTTKLIL
jgi:hypothetical protein